MAEWWEEVAELVSWYAKPVLIEDSGLGSRTVGARAT